MTTGRHGHQQEENRYAAQMGRSDDAPKQATNLRLDPDVLNHYRATGAGWRSRINQALRKAAGLGKRPA